MKRGKLLAALLGVAGMGMLALGMSSTPAAADPYCGLYYSWYAGRCYPNQPPVYYAPPPVTYYPDYYYAPPVVVGPSFGIGFGFGGGWHGGGWHGGSWHGGHGGGWQGGHRH